jgi:predicted ATPase
VAEALWPALREGLVLPLDSEYRFVHFGSGAAGESGADFDVSYRFLHDRVQEAAYSLIPEEARAEAHLRIGMLLAANISTEKREEVIFEIVNQLNRGSYLISSAEERTCVRSVVQAAASCRSTSAKPGRPHRDSGGK